MTLDERLAAQARAAADLITDRQRDLDAARSAHQRAVRALYLAGGSLREIADELGLSHQRVHQLLDMPARSDARGPGRRSAELACSFCDRIQSAVRKLIAGPGVAVCSDCVALAAQVVGHDAPATDARTTVTPAERQRCSFCGKGPQEVEARALADSGAAVICTECLDLCHEILREELPAPG